MKSITLNKFFIITILALLAFAPLQFAFAASANEGGFFSIFTNWRERQIEGRDQVQNNLSRIFSPEEKAPEITTPTSTLLVVSNNSTELITATQQLKDITSRIQEYVIAIKNQGITLSEVSQTSLEQTILNLDKISLHLNSSTAIDTSLITRELSLIRKQLQGIIAELKLFI